MAIWRLLTNKELWDYPRFPITDQAVHNRLEKGGSEPIKQLFSLVRSALSERLASCKWKLLLSNWLLYSKKQQ